MINTPDIKAMIREDKARRNKYFRTYDPVRGDSASEVVPRSPLELDGVTYWVPNEMLRDDFLKAYLKYKGASGLLRATGQYDTEENRRAVVDHIYELRLKYDFEFSSRPVSGAAPRLPKHICTGCRCIGLRTGTPALWLSTNPRR